MSAEDYVSAKKLGEKSYHHAITSGEYPYLPALDEMLRKNSELREEPVGLCEIPIELIIGTRTKGRQEAFAKNYMPLLSVDSEFAMKWINLLRYQEEEGITDPVKAYEFMGRFYILEGNKRVSVLKYLGQPDILADVIRILPPLNDTHEARLYAEFMKFFSAAHIYGIYFSEEGCYEKLADILRTDLNSQWPENIISDLKSEFYNFSKIFAEHGGSEFSITSGDAFLLYISVFNDRSLLDDTETQIRNNINKLWPEYILKSNGNRVTFSEEPAGENKKSSIANVFAGLLKKQETYSEDNPLKIAFIYDSEPSLSRWLNGHEQGRTDMQKNFHGTVDTLVFPNCVTSGEFDTAVERASAEGCKLIITASPSQMDDALRSALIHDEIKFLNCSVHISHKAVRTYCGRMYEAKFLLGMLAAVLTDNNKIGYVSNYPICGTVAGINAFAVGVSMIKPDAKIYLEWSCLKNKNWREAVTHKDTDIISGPDLIRPNSNDNQYGLYRIDSNGKVINYAWPVWNWGKYYSLIAHSVINRTWDSENKDVKDSALNYWWGMSSGVIDVILSEHLSKGSVKLVRDIRKAIIADTIRPFDDLSTEEIISMDTLNPNIVGTFPRIDELTDNAKKAVKANGLPVIS